MIAIYISFCKYFHGDNKKFLNILLFILNTRLDTERFINKHRCRWSKFFKVKVATCLRTVLPSKRFSILPGTKRTKRKTPVDGSTWDCRQRQTQRARDSISWPTSFLNFTEKIAKCVIFLRSTSLKTVLFAKLRNESCFIVSRE